MGLREVLRQLACGRNGRRSARGSVQHAGRRHGLGFVPPSRGEMPAHAPKTCANRSTTREQDIPCTPQAAHRTPPPPKEARPETFEMGIVAPELPSPSQEIERSASCGGRAQRSHHQEPTRLSDRSASSAHRAIPGRKLAGREPRRGNAGFFYPKATLPDRVGRRTIGRPDQRESLTVGSS